MGSTDVLRSWQGLQSREDQQPAQGFPSSNALHRGRGFAVALALALGLAPHRGPAIAQQHLQEDQPIVVDCTSELLDYKNNTAECKNIVVSQGTTRITADTAHGVGLNDQGFQDGRWTFRGNVRIDAAPHGTLRSDEAVVEVRDKRISSATASGKPAEFQQTQTVGGQLTRGHADLIVYDVAAGTVRLTKDAWLTDGQSQISGPLLVYNIKKQQVQADAARPDKRVHITYVPRSNTTAPHSSSSKSAVSRPEGKAEPTPQ